MYLDWHFIFDATETYIMHFLEAARFLNAPVLAGRKVKVLYTPGLAARFPPLPTALKQPLCSHVHKITNYLFRRQNRLGLQLNPLQIACVMDTTASNSLHTRTYKLHPPLIIIATAPHIPLGFLRHIQIIIEDSARSFRLELHRDTVS